jgi:hypothetical protein
VISGSERRLEQWKVCGGPSAKNGPRADEVPVWGGEDGGCGAGDGNKFVVVGTL